MFGFSKRMFEYIILILGCTSAALGEAPPYVQSNEAYTYAKIYVSQLLEPRGPPPQIRTPEARKHFSFSILAGLIGGLVQAAQNSSDFKPLDIIDEYIPHIWSNYETISRKGQRLLNEASRKIELIVDLIDNVCGDDSVGECNAKVDTKVKEAPQTYELAADILLAVGRVSQMIRKHQSQIESIIKMNHEISYLLNNAESAEFRNTILSLKDAYEKIIALQYRKFINNFVRT